MLIVWVVVLFLLSILITRTDEQIPKDESRTEPTLSPLQITCNHQWEIRTESYYIPCAQGEFMPPLSGEYLIRICPKCKLKETI